MIKMHLIYACVFFQEGYCQLAELLIKSFAFTNSISTNIHFLVLCNKKFQQRIESLFKTFYIHGNTWVMEFDTIPTAAMARLHIFDYPTIHEYKKILYVDCDVLITGDLCDLFSLPVEDKLYGLKEGNTKDDMWGARLFQQYNPKVDAICSGVLLFQASPKIETLFANVKKHMNHFRNKNKLPCYDQPFLIYHALQLDLLENSTLEDLVQNNPKRMGSQSVSHFPLWPGHYECKIHDILAFLKGMVKDMPIVADPLQRIWKKVYLTRQKFICSDETELCFEDGLINGISFSFCNKNVITFQDAESRICFIRFDDKFERCIQFQTRETTVEFFEVKNANSVPVSTPVYYICSVGGSAAEWLATQLKKKGKVYHVHSRSPPAELEYVVDGQFTGRKIPTTELAQYIVIVLEQDPVRAILDSFDNVKHLLSLECSTCPDILDVIETQKDLYDIEGFYQKYRESPLPILWTSIPKLLQNHDNILTKLHLACISPPPRFHCPYEMKEVINLNKIDAYQPKRTEQKDNLACRRNYFQSCDIVIRKIQDIHCLVLLKPHQCVGIERIVLQYDFKMLQQYFSCIEYPFTVQIIDSDEDSCCFSVRTENINWLQAHPWVKNIITENWVGGRQEKVIPMPIGLCSRTFSQLETFLASTDQKRSFGEKQCRVSVTFAHMLHQTRNGESTKSGFLPEREDALSILRKNPMVDVLQPMSFPEYLAHYDNYQFTVSPLGNGADCHRTWESILRGTIPIVKRGPLDYLYTYHDFPVVIVNDWSDISETNLKEWATLLVPKLAKMGSFTRTKLLQQVEKSSDDFFFVKDPITL